MNTMFEEELCKTINRCFVLVRRAEFLNVPPTMGGIPANYSAFEQNFEYWQ
jgi:hypothetical protein